MILTVFLLAPTVPSEPRPQILQLTNSDPQNVDLRFQRQGQEGHVVLDAHCKVIFRLLGSQIFEKQI